MSWNIEFYETEGGRIPVEEFLDSLPIKHRAKSQFVIDLLAEYGHLLKEPFTKQIFGTKLKELRIQASPNIYRIFYFAHIDKNLFCCMDLPKRQNKHQEKK